VVYIPEMRSGSEPPSATSERWRRHQVWPCAGPWADAEKSGGHAIQQLQLEEQAGPRPKWAMALPNPPCSPGLESLARPPIVRAAYELKRLRHLFRGPASARGFQCADRPSAGPAKPRVLRPAAAGRPGGHRGVTVLSLPLSCLNNVRRWPMRRRAENFRRGYRPNG
jgi:hypothetical protein